MRISFIGSGNVASHLATAFYKAQHNIIEIHSLNQENAEILADMTQSSVLKKIEDINENIDLCFICVPDQYIEGISSRLPKNITHIHTSGNTLLSQLKGNTTGVFYPLQTFSKNKLIDYSTLNILLESDDTHILNLMKQLASDLKSQIHFVNSKERQKLHVAAVFACNFSNLMVDISEELLSDNQLDSKLLLPLILETTNKLKTLSAKQAQTGPAIRGDKNTIQNHQDILKQYSPSVQNIYEVLTKEIQKRHGKL